jgi:hypothetical protein
MTNMDVLIDEARSADPGDRILYRDRIVAHGAAAIPAMRAWLEEPRLGAFAVRVLERIAIGDSNRRPVLDALNSAEAGILPERVAHDIAEAIARLGGSKRVASTRARKEPRTLPEGWPGQRRVSPVELKFHDAMLDIFTLAGVATRKQRPDGSTFRGYWASYFLRGVRNHGGPEYAHRLLRAEGTTEGFQRLTAEGRLDLTMEALVLRPEFSELFTGDERAIAASRLAKAGYQPPRD